MTNLLRRVFRTCVIVGLPLLCHCDDRVMVHIRVTGAPSTVRTLRVFAELNGKPALSADEFQDPLQEVNLVLPRSALGEGKLFVSIIGLDVSDCRVGYGKLITEVQAAPQKTEAEVSLTGLPTICNWRQSGWGSSTSPPGMSLCLRIRGSAAENIWVSGIGSGTGGKVGLWTGLGWDVKEVSKPSPSQLNAVWVRSERTVWTVGTNSAVFLWDGQEWQSKSLGNPVVSLNGVWSSSSGLVWVAGDNGLVARYDGTWMLQATGSTVYLFDIWGSDSQNIWAVGGGGTILFWRATSNMWMKENLPSSSYPALRGIWGVDSAHVWAVGDAGAIYGRIQGSWQKQASKTSGQLNAIWGPDLRHLWAVGDNGVIIEWNGEDWEARTAGVTVRLRSVWGTDAYNVWVVGDDCTLLHYSPL